MEIHENKKKKGFFARILGFFGIEISRLNYTVFEEIEEEIHHLSVTVKSDINLFKEEAFTQNTIERIKSLVKTAKKEVIKYLEGKDKETSQQIAQIIETSILPFLKAHIHVDKIKKEAETQLKRDINITIDLFEKLREDE